MLTSIEAMIVKQIPYILPMLYLRIQHTLTTRARARAQNRDDTTMDCKKLPHPSLHGDTRDLVNRFTLEPREIGLGFRNRSFHCHNQVELNDYLSGALGGLEDDLRIMFRPNIGGLAESWYNQLKPDVRKDWTRVREAGTSSKVALDVEPAGRKGKMFTASMTAVGFEGGQEPEGIAITTKMRNQIQKQIDISGRSPRRKTGDKFRVLTAGRPSRRARLHSRRDPGR